MTWANAFDLGECTVTTAYVTNPSIPLYTSVLGKGGSHTFVHTGNTYTISVSSLGVVTLANSDTTVGLSDDMLVYVYPAYSLATMIGAESLQSISCVGTGKAGAVSSFATTVSFDSSVTPQDVDLTAQTPYVRIWTQTDTATGSKITPILQFTPQFNVPTPPAPVPDCTELGRVTRSFVSGYTAARTEVRRIHRFAKRCILADFNGAFPATDSIASVRFDCTSPWSIFMSNPRVITGGRKVAVDANFNYAGWGAVMATVTLASGDTYNQQFFFSVLDRPLYPSAVYSSAVGPYVLYANA